MTRESSFIPSEIETIFWPKKPAEVRTPYLAPKPTQQKSKSTPEIPLYLQREGANMETKAARPEVKAEEVRAAQKAKAAAEKAARDQARLQKIYASCEQRDGEVIDRFGAMFGIQKELVLSIFTAESSCNPKALGPDKDLDAWARGQVTKKTYADLIKIHPILSKHRTTDFGDIGGSIAQMRKRMDEMRKSGIRFTTFGRISAWYHAGLPHKISPKLLEQMRIWNPEVAKRQKDPKSVESYYEATEEFMFQAYPEMRQRVVDLAQLPLIDRSGFALAAAEFPLPGKKPAPATMVASAAPARKQEIPVPVDIYPVETLIPSPTAPAAEVTLAELPVVSEKPAMNESDFPEYGIQTFALEQRGDYGQAVAIAPMEEVPMVAEAPAPTFNEAEEELRDQLMYAQAPHHTAVDVGYTPSSQEHMSIHLAQLAFTPSEIAVKRQLEGAYAAIETESLVHKGTEAKAPALKPSIAPVKPSEFMPLQPPIVVASNEPVGAGASIPKWPLSDADFYMTVPEQESHAKAHPTAPMRPASNSALLSALQIDSTLTLPPQKWTADRAWRTKPIWSKILRPSPNLYTTNEGNIPRAIRTSISKELTSGGVYDLAQRTGYKIPRGNSSDIHALYAQQDATAVGALQIREWYAIDNLPYEARFLDLTISAPRRQEGFARSCAVLRGGEWVVPAGTWGNKTGKELPLALYQELLQRRGETITHTIAYKPQAQRKTRAV